MYLLRVLKLHPPVFALPLIATVMLLALSTSPVYGADVGRSVIGRWKIVAALDGAEITSRNEVEAKQFVGHEMTISDKVVLIAGEDCLPPDFEATSVEPNLYLREQAHASASLLKLPNPVTVVDLGCTIAFIKNANRIVVFWDGWFFDAVRVKGQRVSASRTSHPIGSK